jgi:hypothetical protein
MTPADRRPTDVFCVARATSDLLVIRGLADSGYPRSMSSSPLVTQFAERDTLRRPVLVILQIADSVAFVLAFPKQLPRRTHGPLHLPQRASPRRQRQNE